jgi:L-ascorbate metabolism protein UlaG (beta-lactamase superfamily)
MFFALLGLAGALAAAPVLEVRHIGNMGFLISDGTTTLAIDFPYQSGAFGYQTWKEADVGKPAGEVIALFTHRHADHFDAGLLASRGWAAFGPEDVVSRIPAEKRADLKSLEGRGIKIEPLKTPHANVGHYSYLIDWKGLRIYHSGDTEEPGSLIAAGAVDLALVSPWVLKAAGDKDTARRELVCHVAPGEAVEALPEGASLAVPGAVLRLSSGGLTGPERP